MIQSNMHEHHRQQHQQQQHQHDHVRDQLIGLAQKVQAIEGAIKEARERQEQFVLKLQDRSTAMANVHFHEQLLPPDPLRLEQARHERMGIESFLQQLARKIEKGRCQMLSEHKEIFVQLSDIQHEVLFVHLPRWHLDQQLANNGVQKETNSLDRIQSWVELLTDITWRLRNQMVAMHTLSASTPVLPSTRDQEMNQLGLCINKSLETLILNTFVVEKQPPQVMKTNTRFTSTVRYLCNPGFNVHHNNKPLVRVSILSEHNARAIKQRHHEILQSDWSYLHEPPQRAAALNHHHQQQQQQQQQQQHPPTNIISPLEQQQQHQSVIYRAASQSVQASMTDDSLLLLETTAQAPQSQPLQGHYMDMAGNDLSPAAPLPPTTAQQQFFQQQLQQQQYQIVHPQKGQVPMQVQYRGDHTTTAANNHAHQHQTSAGSILSNKINIDDFDPSGEILNNSNQIEYQESTGQLVCHFRNMQLKKIKRTEKKGTESVMDEKFILVFHVQFRIDEQYQAQSPWFHQRGDLSFHVFALSLPVVVIVHGNQDPHAWATVTWHNAFARQDELLYYVPDKVSWAELGQVLSNKFRSYAGRGLNGQNLAYLASKISRFKLENDEGSISWNQFAKEPLPDISFTFWEWFHSILKLTKDHLRELWNAERIYGFVGRNGCVDVLLGSSSTYHEPQAVGTFLLRYSETELGAISIAWVSAPSQATNNKSNFIQVWKRNSPTNTTNNVIQHLQPFLSKDLQTRTLADRIRDLNDLVTLYPNIPKDEAFGVHYTPINSVDSLANGYIRPMLIQTLVANYPKNSGAGSISESAVTPATPNSYSQSSPDGIYQDNNFMNDLEPSYQAYDPVV